MALSSTGTLSASDIYALLAISTTIPKRFVADLVPLLDVTHNNGDPFNLTKIRGKGKKVTVAPGLYVFSTHTFTNAGKTGRYGPILSDIQSTYSSTVWASDVNLLNMTTQGIQIWTVPKTSVFTFVIAGAAGGSSTQNAFRGKGRVVSGSVQLTQGDKLYIVVGQLGDSAYYETGGGGGTFIYLNSMSSSTILLAAGGGGGGNGYVNLENNIDGNIDTNGLKGGEYSSPPGGTNGSGGSGGVAGGGVWNGIVGGSGIGGDGGIAGAGGGGGYGIDSTTSFIGGTSPANTSSLKINGGFGGGGGGAKPGSGGGSGGGGGYSGGAGGSRVNGYITYSGGGGGSFASTSVSNYNSNYSLNISNGYVTISTQ